MNQIGPKVTNRIRLLDSLRGIAALIVLHHHIFKFNGDFFSKNFRGVLFSMLSGISELNREAVLFFFILSGFSIGLSLKNVDLSDRKVINEYIYRRLKRILPIYWISLVLALFIGFITYRYKLNDYGLLNLIGNLLFLQTGTSVNGFIVPYGENGPLWSLAYEFFFYLLFPIVFVFNRMYLRHFNIISKFAFLLCASIVSISVNKYIPFPYFSFFGLFIVWLLGYMCCLAYLRGHRYDMLFVAVALTSLCYLFFGQTVLPSNSIIGVCKGMLLSSIFYLFTIFSASSFVIRISNTPIRILNFLFFFIGKGSFAIYALHYPILLLFNHFGLIVLFQYLTFAALIIGFVNIEEATIKLKMLFLKRVYLPVHP